METRDLVRTVAPFVVVGVIVALRARKMGSVQPMRLNRLWIRPAIVGVISTVVLFVTPPSTFLEALALVSVAGVGAVIGWHQAKLMAISVDEATGALNVKASRWGMITLLGIILVRMALRPWLTGPDSPLHASVGLVTDGFVLFIAGFYVARSAEMFLRGRALLASRPATPTSLPPDAQPSATPER